MLQLWLPPSSSFSTVGGFLCQPASKSTSVLGVDFVAWFGWLSRRKSNIASIFFGICLSGFFFGSAGKLSRKYLAGLGSGCYITPIITNLIPQPVQYSRRGREKQSHGSTTASIPIFVLFFPSWGFGGKASVGWERVKVDLPNLPCSLVSPFTSCPSSSPLSRVFLVCTSLLIPFAASSTLAVVLIY